MTVKRMTIGEFIDNIEKDGLPQTQRMFFRTDDAFDETWWINKPDKKIGSACAMGQGMINSGILEVKARENSPFYKIQSIIFAMNDYEGLSLKEIVDRIRETFPEAMKLKVWGDEFDFTPYLPDTYAPKDN